MRSWPCGPHSFSAFDNEYRKSPKKQINTYGLKTTSKVSRLPLLSSSNVADVKIDLDRRCMKRVEQVAVGVVFIGSSHQSNRSEQASHLLLWACTYCCRHALDLHEVFGGGHIEGLSRDVEGYRGTSRVRRASRHRGLDVGRAWEQRKKTSRVEPCVEGTSRVVEPTSSL